MSRETKRERKTTFRCIPASSLDLSWINSSTFYPYSFNAEKRYDMTRSIMVNNSIKRKPIVLYFGRKSLPFYDTQKLNFRACFSLAYNDRKLLEWSTKLFRKHFLICQLQANGIFEIFFSLKEKRCNKKRWNYLQLRDKFNVTDVTWKYRWFEIYLYLNSRLSSV